MGPGASDSQWQAHQAFAARFYLLPVAQQLWANYSRRLLQRTNQITGILYRSAAWARTSDLAVNSRTSLHAPLRLFTASPHLEPVARSDDPAIMAWQLANEPRGAEPG